MAELLPEEATPHGQGLIAFPGTSLPFPVRQIREELRQHSRPLGWRLAAMVGTAILILWVMTVRNEPARTIGITIGLALVLEGTFFFNTFWQNMPLTFRSWVQLRLVTEVLEQLPAELHGFDPQQPLYLALPDDPDGKDVKTAAELAEKVEAIGTYYDALIGFLHRWPTAALMGFGPSDVIRSVQMSSHRGLPEAAAKALRKLKERGTRLYVRPLRHT